MNATIAKDMKNKFLKMFIPLDLPPHGERNLRSERLSVDYTNFFTNCFDVKNHKMIKMSKQM